jgi:NADH-quinone oxidoreductase subunit A
MGYQLVNVLVFTVFGVAFVVMTIAVISRFLRPRVADPVAEPSKMETYECGEPTVGSSWVRFDIRFYTVALIFLIFDVEVTLLYPWALVFKELAGAKVGMFVFSEAGLFLLILGAGLVYCWKKGDLDWVKAVSSPRSIPRERLPRKSPVESRGEPALR